MSNMEMFDLCKHIIKTIKDLRTDDVYIGKTHLDIFLDQYYSFDYDKGYNKEEWIPECCSSNLPDFINPDLANISSDLATLRITQEIDVENDSDIVVLRSYKRKKFAIHYSRELISQAFDYHSNSKEAKPFCKNKKAIAITMYEYKTTCTSCLKLLKEEELKKQRELIYNVQKRNEDFLNAYHSLLHLIRWSKKLNIPIQELEPKLSDEIGKYERNKHKDRISDENEGFL